MFILNTKLKTLLEVNLAIRKCTIIFKPCIKAVAALFIIGSITFAHATLLDTGNWSQIGQMSSGGGMFNGNCSLSLTGCTFDDGNDF
jgi:Trk-type K+ transport system membrane component